MNPITVWNDYLNESQQRYDEIKESDESDNSQHSLNESQKNMYEF